MLRLAVLLTVFVWGINVQGNGDNSTPQRERLPCVIFEKAGGGLDQVELTKAQCLAHIPPCCHDINDPFNEHCWRKNPNLCPLALISPTNRVSCFAFTEIACFNKRNKGCCFEWILRNSNKGPCIRVNPIPCDPPIPANMRVSCAAATNIACEELPAELGCCWDQDVGDGGTCIRMNPIPCKPPIPENMRVDCDASTLQDCEDLPAALGCCWDPDEGATGACYRMNPIPCKPPILENMRLPCEGSTLPDCEALPPSLGCCWDPDEGATGACYRMNPIPCKPPIPEDRRVTCEASTLPDCEALPPSLECCWDPDEGAGGTCYRECDENVELPPGKCSKTCGIGIRVVRNECDDIVRLEKCCYKPCDVKGDGTPPRDLCRNYPTFNGQP